MQSEDLATILESTGLPTTETQWIASANKPIPPLPYIVYLSPGTENFSADNKVLLVITNYDIELYSKKKDKVSESKIETALSESEIFWDKVELFIPEEKMYQVTYSIQV